MNRGFHQFFHSTAQSSFARPVETLWTLCQTGAKLWKLPFLTVISGAHRTDFSHEGLRRN